MSLCPLFWDPASTPTELHALLTTLADGYPISATAAAGTTALTFVKASKAGLSKVEKRGDGVQITYSDLCSAARGVGTALANLTADEHSCFQTLGIMLDCSRNAVMKVDQVCKWLRQLALMGYNRAMLYTEDTYELPGEPYFGYMRGAYTESELKALDAYAAKLGIELIGCIQALGHLEQILRWPAYDSVRDTGGVMLVDNPDTYALIDKMVATCAKCFASRTLHIGMDETHDLGRGRFMDKFGYERGFDLFNRHLTKVVEICKKHGLKPMIWSDMYFRLGNPNMDYYAKNTVIPEDVKKGIPPEVDLVYWDYYNFDEGFYADWIQRHRDLGKDPLLGSGVWSWCRFWYDHDMTKNTVRPGLLAARKAKLAHVFFTMWGDDGAYCEYDSVMAGLAYAAELSWGNDPDTDFHPVSARLAAITGEDYLSCLAFSAIEYPDGGSNVDRSAKVAGHALLWDDPLLGIHFTDAEASAPGWMKSALTIYDRLGSWPTDGATPSVRYAALLTQTLARKLRFRRDLVQAYFAGDRLALGALADMKAPKLANLYRELLAMSRDRWMARNKPFGWEVVAMRMNAQIGRIEETAMRIREYLQGYVANIPELDESRKITKDSPRSGTYMARGTMSGSMIF